MGKAFTTSEFIEKSKFVHGEKYQYNKTVYKLSRIKVCITCPKHGDFYQTPNSHLNRNGCPRCSAEKTSIRRFNRVIVNCIVCGKEISKNKAWVERSERHLCSPECWSKWAKDSGIFRGESSATWKGALKTVICTTCGKPFQRYQSDHKNAKNVFCSHVCWNKYIVTNPGARDQYPTKFCLCVECHDKFHKTFGRGENTRKQLGEFLMAYKNECSL